MCLRMAPEERPSASLSGTINVFLFDFALAGLARAAKTTLYRTLPFQYNVPCLFHLSPWCWPLDRTVILLQRRCFVVFGRARFDFL